MFANLKLYAITATLLAIGFLVWREHVAVQKAKALAVQNAQLTATISAERENTRKANESANRYALRIATSRGPRSPPSRLLCKLPRLVPSAGTAVPGDYAAPAPDDSGVSEEVDLGPRLDLSFHACEENLIKLDELQRWVRER